MDPSVSAASKLVSFLLKEGLIMFATTATCGIMMGPVGLAIGGAAGGVAATVSTVRQTSGWSRIAAAVTGFVISVLPHFFSLEYVSSLLNGLANFVVRLLRSGGLLPASELSRAISYPPRRYEDRDDGPGTVH